MKYNTSLPHCFRCVCGLCESMATEKECRCCLENDNVRAVVEDIDEEDLESSQDITCVTQHPGFKAICLNRYSLDMSYYAYKQHYGSVNAPRNRKYRYIAYRCFESQYHRVLFTEYVPNFRYHMKNVIQAIQIWILIGWHNNVIELIYFYLVSGYIITNKLYLNLNCSLFTRSTPWKRLVCALTASALSG